MKFTKMHGCGNDYIYIDCFKETVSDPSSLSVRLSDRHRGIGGDGIVLIGPSDKADLQMRIFNRDGSEAEMCGNAARCVGRYAYERGLTDRRELTLETKAGVRTLRLFVTDGSVDAVEVGMGKALAAMLPADRLSDVIPAALSARLAQIWTVDTGNPHCVLLLKDLSALNIEETGPKIECHPLFPERTNVEFVTVKDRTELTMRVWERGSGETLACGTGACAAAAAAFGAGMVDGEILVRLAGGELKVTVGQDGTVTQRGMAAMVFDGEVILE